MHNPYLQMIIATMILGTSGVFVDVLNLPSSTLTFFRTFFPALALFGYFIFRKSLSIIVLDKLLLIASTFNAIRLFFFFVALNNTSVGNTFIILNTGAIFTAIYSSIFLKENIGKIKIIAMLTALLGIGIIYSTSTFTFSNSDFIGMTAALLSTVIYSATVVIFKKKLEEYSTWEAIFYQNLIPAILFLPFIFINQPFPSPEKWGLGIVYGITIGIIGFIFQFNALRQLEASITSILAYLITPFSIFFAYIFLGEEITRNMIIGGAMIVGSALALQRLKDS